MDSIFPIMESGHGRTTAGTMNVFNDTLKAASRQRRRSSNLATPVKSSKTPGKRMPLTPRHVNLPFHRPTNTIKAWATPSHLSDAFNEPDEVLVPSIAPSVLELKETIHRVERERDIEEQKVAKAQQQIQALQAKLINSDEDVEQYKLECDKIQEKFDCLQIEGKKMYKLFLARGELAQQLKEKLTHAQEECNSEIMRSKKTEALCARVLCENRVLRDAINSFTADAQEMQSLAEDDHTMELASHKSEIRSLENELENAQSEIQRLESQMRETQKKCAELSDQLCEHMAASAVTTASAECELEALRRANEDRTVQLKTSLSASEQKCDELSTKLAQQLASSAIDSASGEIELEDQLNYATIKIQELQTEVAALKKVEKTRVIGKAAFKTLTEELAESRNELKDSRVEVAQLKLSEFQSTKANTAHELAQHVARKAITAGTHMVFREAASISISRLQNQIAIEKMERERVSNELKQYETTFHTQCFTPNAEIVDQLTVAQNECIELKNEIQNLCARNVAARVVSNAISCCMPTVSTKEKILSSMLVEPSARRDSLESWGTWSVDSATDQSISVDDFGSSSPFQNQQVSTTPVDNNTPRSRIQQHLPTFGQYQQLPFVVVDNHTPHVKQTAYQTPLRQTMVPSILVDDYSPRPRSLSRQKSKNQTPVKANPMVVIQDFTPPPHITKKVSRTTNTSPLATHEVSCSPVPHPRSVSTATMTVSPLSNFQALAEDESPETLRSQIDSLTISTELLREELASKSTELEKHTALSINAEKKTADLTNELQICQTELQRVSDLLFDVQNTNTQLATSNEANSTHIDTLEVQLANATASLATTNEEIIELRSQLDATAPNENVVQELEETQRKLASTQDKHNLATKELNHKLNQQIAVNKNLQSDMSMIYARSKRETAALEAKYRHEDYKSRYETVNTKLCKLESQISNLKTSKTKIEETARLQTACSASIKASNEKLQAEISKFNADRSSWEEKKVISEQDMQQKAMENVQLREQAQAYEAHKAELSDENDCLKADISALRATCDDLEVKLNTVTFELDSASNELASMTELQHTNSELMNTVNELNNQIAAGPDPSTLAQISDLHSIIEDKDELNQRLQCQLEEKARQYTELSSFVEEERIVREGLMDDMEKDLEAARADVTPLETALQIKEDELAQAGAAITILEERIACLQADQASELERQVATISNELGTQLASLENELNSTRTMLEQLGGELCEKELALHEANQMREASEKALASAQSDAFELDKTKTKFRDFRTACEEKISVLQENLAKSEAEVAYLDGELSRITTAQ